MTFYAWRTTNLPKASAAAAGCPASGWVHAGGPPWRVITFRDLSDGFTLPHSELVEYVGDEDTVLWDDLLPPPARSTARADADRLHYRDEQGRVRCPEEYSSTPTWPGFGPNGTDLRVIRCPHLFDVIRYEQVNQPAPAVQRAIDALEPMAERLEATDDPFDGDAAWGIREAIKVLTRLRDEAGT